MSKKNRPTHTGLGDIQGPAPFDDEEIFELRRRAWHEQGLLITSLADLRLTSGERASLNRIGEVLYGKRGSHG